MAGAPTRRAGSAASYPPLIVVPGQPAPQGQRRLPPEFEAYERVQRGARVTGFVESYSTTFGLTENPISESGRWRTGLTTGGNWTDPQTASGIAYGTQPGSPVAPPYNDSIGCLSGFSANHSAQGTVALGASDGASFHEVELLLRFDIKSGAARGYECSFGFTSGRASTYLVIVRWNGSLNSFDQLQDFGAISGGINDGDVLFAQIVGNNITVKKNGSTIATLDVSTGVGASNVWVDGNPGVGFWQDGGTPALTTFAYTNYTATSL